MASLIGYAFVYTMFLKRATPQNIVIGGLAGAAPPLLGWTAVTGEIHGHALLLVLIIFCLDATTLLGLGDSPARGICIGRDSDVTRYARRGVYRVAYLSLHDNHVLDHAITLCDFVERMALSPGRHRFGRDFYLLVYRNLARQKSEGAHGNL